MVSVGHGIDVSSMFASLVSVFNGVPSYKQRLLHVVGYGGMPGVQGGIVPTGGLAPGICAEMSCLRQHLTRNVTTPKEHGDEMNDILFNVEVLLNLGWRPTSSVHLETNSVRGS